MEVKGVGDVVASITKALGIVPCQSCKERQALWNNMFPIRLKPRELTENELNEYKDFQNIRTLKLDNTQRKWLCKIYSDVFQVPYYEPCPSCSSAPYLKMIERMDEIVKTYNI